MGLQDLGNKLNYLSFVISMKVLFSHMKEDVHKKLFNL